MYASKYVEEKGSVTMLASIRSPGVVPEVNLRESVTCMPLPSMSKAAHPGFETQKRCHQKSKTGVSVAPQKGTYVLKTKLKKTCYFSHRRRQANVWHSKIKTFANVENAKQILHCGNFISCVLLKKLYHKCFVY